jgi:hypothetical protein
MSPCSLRVQDTVPGHGRERHADARTGLGAMTMTLALLKMAEIGARKIAVTKPKIVALQ